MPIFKSFKVNVLVPFRAPEGYLKNLSLVEYGAKSLCTESDSYQCTRYIAAVNDSQFSIIVENGAPQDASVLFFVDGQMACCLLCYAKPKYNVVTCQGVQPKAGVLQRFIFKKTTHYGTSLSTQIDTSKIVRASTVHHLTRLGPLES
jgi:hypothetical protein